MSTAVHTSSVIASNGSSRDSSVEGEDDVTSSSSSLPSPSPSPASLEDPWKNGWEELMGSNITMKVMEETKDLMEEEQIESSTQTHPLSLYHDSLERKQYCELKDIVRMDITGYALHHDDDDNGDKHDPSPPLRLLENLLHGNSTSEIPFLNVKNWLVTLGDGDVPPGLEMAARFLGSNRTALVRIHSKFMYGAAGRLDSHNDNNAHNYKEYSVPPYTTVLCRLVTKGVLSPTSPIRKRDDFRIEMALQKKIIGNDAYRHEWTRPSPNVGMGKTRAVKLYGNASEAMMHLVDDIRSRNGDATETRADATAALLDRATSILVDCLNNLSAVHLRDRNYEKAKEAATQAIRLDPNNLRALCRAAKAAMLHPSSLVWYEEADAALLVAEGLVQQQQQAGGRERGEDELVVRRLRGELVRRQREYAKSEKAMYVKMMSKNTETRAKTLKNEDGNDVGDIERKNDETASEKISSLVKDDSNQDDISTKNQTLVPMKLFVVVLVPVLIIALVLYLQQSSRNKPNDTDDVMQAVVAVEESEF